MKPGRQNYPYHQLIFQVPSPWWNPVVFCARFMFWRPHWSSCDGQLSNIYLIELFVEINDGSFIRNSSNSFFFFKNCYMKCFKTSWVIVETVQLAITIRNKFEIIKDVCPSDLIFTCFRNSEVEGWQATKNLKFIHIKEQCNSTGISK